MHWQRLLASINRRGWAVLLVLAVVSTLSPFVPALLALGFATGFMLDRAAFRFSSPDVRQAPEGCCSHDFFTDMIWR